MHLNIYLIAAFMHSVPSSHQVLDGKLHLRIVSLAVVYSTYSSPVCVICNDLLSLLFHIYISDRASHSVTMMGISQESGCFGEHDACEG